MVIFINEMSDFNYTPELPSSTTITINDISIHLYIVENSIWLFSNEHLAKNYEISQNTVRQHLKRNKDKLIEGNHWFKKKGWKPPHFPHFTLWTKQGFIKFGNFVKTAKADLVLTALGVKSRQTTKIESEVTEIIKRAFQGITDVKTQFSISGYKADLYLPELNIIVEIDEHNHDSYSPNDEDQREIVMKESLNCKIFRHNPHDKNKNIGDLINRIFKELIKIYNAIHSDGQGRAV